MQAIHRTFLLALAGLLPAAWPAAAEPPADDPVLPRYSHSPASQGWTASVQGEDREPAVATGPAEFRLRLYAGGGGIAEDLDGRAIALDVEAEIETCADGSTRVNGVRIGSWRYALEGSCVDRRSGRLHVSRPASETRSGDSGLRLHCRRASFSCSPASD